MARQVLENGVILPAEYSDDWYDDMTSNLTKLDDVIGSDSEKLSSADVGAAALSNSYNDLDNLPTIPTVNDATLTIQKNGVDVQTFTANASSNVTANITVPTKTSDLTNDSNFVDTSNPAVASGITSAKVTSYDSHVADTDIHVTTADKNRWNNQTYVFRYSSTALVASSTNSNTLLDNTDNLKVGDKVIDSSGVLFSITAIDTANSTFTIGTALVDLATDSDVVHKSGNETVAGFKEFANIRATNSIKGINLDSTTTDLNNCYSDFASSDGSRAGNIQYYYCNTDSGTANISNLPETRAFFLTSIITRLISSSLYVKQILINSNSKTFVRYCNNSTWSSWVNETDKYVTTDTAQTISGAKTFTDNNMIKTSSPKVLLINTSQTGNTAPSSNTASFLRFDGGTVNNFGGVQCEFLTTGENRLANYVNDITKAKVNIIQQRASSTTAMTVFNADLLAPANDGVTALGSSSRRWSDCQTKLINGLTPSSLSLPGDTSIDISGYVTDLTGGNNQYTVPENGWVHVDSNTTISSVIINNSRGYSSGFIFSGQLERQRNTLPVCKGDLILINVNCASLNAVRFIPCQGNV